MKEPVQGLTARESTAIMIRIRHDDLALIKRAAKHSGLHRATFIRMAAIERAREVLSDNKE